MAKKKKKPSLHNADKWFSIYIRLRDVGEDGYGHCCSCGKRLFWRDGDAGHFIPRQHRSTRFHQKNVHLQCRKCNRFDNGAPAGYALFLFKKYDQLYDENGKPFFPARYLSHEESTVNMLGELSKRIVKWTAFEINNMAYNFQEAAKQIANEKGIVL